MKCHSEGATRLKNLLKFGRFLATLGMTCLFCLPAFAEVPPVPGEKQTIEKLNAQLAKEKKEEKQLEKQIQGLKTELKSTKGQLVDLAQKIKTNERDLNDLEQKIDKLQREQLMIEMRLGEDQKSMAQLILALQRMRRVPPEAMLARPGAPLETAQSAMLLESVLPRIHERAEQLRVDLKRLEEVVQGVKDSREKVLSISKQLDKRHSQMTALLKDRENLFKKTQKDYKRHAADIARISKQARSLKDLVARIEENQRREAARKTTKKALQRHVKSIPKSGSAQIPVSGIIRVSYGEQDNIGAKSQGIRIESRPKSLVVAPMGGVIRFSGEFKNYGPMVIIEHRKGYHSLIAGLGRIDTVVGQSVSAGEPIGLMQDSALGAGKPSLYYELRHKGQPVNPARKFADLG